MGVIKFPFGPFKDFHACVQANPDKQNPEAYCASLHKKVTGEWPKEALRTIVWTGKLDESPDLDWLPENIKDKRPLVTGRAIHPVKTFHLHEWPNVRVYLEEELAKAAPGWIGTTPYLDHYWPLEGWNVVATKYTDGELKYAIVPKEDRALQAIRDGDIEHVSIEFDWMVPGGGLKFVDGVAPFGFEPSHISFLKDMEPGDPTTTVQLWESKVVPGLREHILRASKTMRTQKLGLKEQVPAQPVVPVGPITIEQKVASIEDEIASIRNDIANILGMLGQRPTEGSKEVCQPCVEARARWYIKQGLFTEDEIDEALERAKQFYLKYKEQTEPEKLTGTEPLPEVGPEETPPKCGPDQVYDPEFKQCVQKPITTPAGSQAAEETPPETEQVTTPPPTMGEQATPTDPVEPIKCGPDEVYNPDLHQCVKKEEPTPAESTSEQNEMTREECEAQGGVWDPETKACALDEEFKAQLVKEYLKEHRLVDAAVIEGVLPSRMAWRSWSFGPQTFVKQVRAAIGLNPEE